LRKEYTTKEDWLEDILTNSNSKDSLKSAETALRTFDIFYKVKVGLDNPNIIDLDIEKAQKLKRHALTSMERYQIDQEYWSQVKKRCAKVCQIAQEQIIQQYRSWFESGDVQSIFTSVQRWVRFCSQDHPEVTQHRHMTWKAKKSNSIKSYWASIKDYLRICHGIKIYEYKICHVRKRGINSFDKYLSFTYGTNHWQINLALKLVMRNMPCGIT